MDDALVKNGSYSGIARQYHLSDDAVRRHADLHLPASIVKAREVEEITDADRLKGELEGVKEDVHRLKDLAESEGDYRTALTACDKALKALELQAKVLQLIQDAPRTEVVLISPLVQTVIIGALQHYPEARQAVADALGEIEHLEAS